MRGWQPRDEAFTSLRLLRDQQAMPFQFYGWPGLLVQDFPMYSPALDEILYQVAPREIILIPIDGQGTLFVFLMRGYDDFTARAVLFTADQEERRCAHITASDALAVLEEAFEYFSLPSREGEQSKAPTIPAMQGMRLGNIYYRLPGWPDWCFVFFPTSGDRALMVLMISPSQEAKRRARVVRVSPDGSGCSQYTLQAETSDQAIIHTLYRHRFGGIVHCLLHRARRLQLPPRFSAPLRLVGGVVGILLTLLFQLAAVGFLLGMISEQVPLSSGIVSVCFPLSGFFGSAVVLLPVYFPCLVTSPPNFRKQLQRWLLGFLLVSEYGTFLFATALSGHLWDASLILVAGFFLWLTLTPVYAGAEIGRMFHGRKMRMSYGEGVELS